MRDTAVKSEHAAERKTIQVWACKRCGRAYSDNESGERLARYCCADTFPCKCGSRYRKPYRMCESCREADAIRRWQSLEEVEWDGETPLYDEVSETFLFDPEEDIRCEHGGLDPDNLRLRLCKPEDPPWFDIHDYLVDFHHPGIDDELPGNWEAAEKAVNEYLRSILPHTWMYTNKRVVWPFRNASVEDV